MLQATPIGVVGPCEPREADYLTGSPSVCAADERPRGVPDGRQRSSRDVGHLHGDGIEPEVLRRLVRDVGEGFVGDEELTWDT